MVKSKFYFISLSNDKFDRNGTRERTNKQQQINKTKQQQAKNKNDHDNEKEY